LPELLSGSKGRGIRRVGRRRGCCHCSSQVYTILVVVGLGHGGRNKFELVERLLLLKSIHLPNRLLYRPLLGKKHSGANPPSLHNIEISSENREASTTERGRILRITPRICVSLVERSRKKRCDMTVLTLTGKYSPPSSSLNVPAPSPPCTSKAIVRSQTREQ
jgi:hypothetical protein